MTRRILPPPMATLKFWLWPSKGFPTADDSTPRTPQSKRSAQRISQFRPENHSAYREELRARLGKMTDAELRRFAQAAQRLCSSSAHCGESVWNLFTIQLEECQAEWRERHPHL